MLAFERHGSGEPLVLVHGVTHRRQAWYPVLDRLTDHREVILVDLPGHGDSPPLELAGRPVEDVLRAQFTAFLTEQQLVRPHVGGNSLGGLVSLIAAAEGDARSVTALSPAGFWSSNAEFGYTRQIFQRFCALSARLGDRAEAVARTRAGRQLIYSLLCAHPARVSADQAIGDARAFRYARPALQILLDAAQPFDRVIAPGVPVTVAWAARDLVLPPWQAARARELLPQARHVLMRGVGHVPMTDNPAFVAKVLLRGSEPVHVDPSLASVTSLAAAKRRRKPAGDVATA